MPGLGKNIGDAYIQVHSDMGPFRREVRAEAAAAGADAGDDFDRSFGSRLRNMRVTVGKFGTVLSDFNRRLGERFQGVDIGLSRLRGSRNDFLNILGGMSKGLENIFGTALRETFAVVGSTIAGFGRTLAQGEGPLAGFGRALDRVGLSIGRLGGGGIDGLVIQLATLLLALEALLGIAGVVAAGISTITGALTALTITIGGGLLGFVTALGPAMLGLAAGTGAASLAIAGLTKAQKSALAPLKEWVKEIQVLTRDELFGNIGAQANVLAGVLSSTLNPLLVRSAGVLREFFDGFIETIQGGAFSGVMQTLSAQLPNLLRNLLDIIGGLSGGLLNIFAAAAPGANRLFEAINRVVQGFLEWTSSAGGVTTINRFMNEAIDVLSTLWGIAKNLGTTLAILWDEGAAGGQSLLDSIGQVVQQFTTWLGSTEGRDALTRWFNTAVIVGNQLGTVIRQVVDLFNALDTEQTRTFFIVFVGHVQAAIGALTTVVGWVQSATTWFLDFGNQVSNVFSGITSAATSWVSGAIAAVQRFVAVNVAGFRGFLAAVRGVFGQIGNTIRSAATFMTNIQVAAINGVIGAFNRLRSLGSAAIASIRSILNTLTAPLRAAVVAIQSIIDRFGGLRGIANSVISGIRSILGALARAFIVNVVLPIGRVVALFQGLRQVAVNAVNSILSAFRSINLFSIGQDIINGLSRGISNAASGLLSYVRSLGNQVASAFADVLGIASPSRIFRNFGGNIVLGLIDGMRKRERDASEEGDRLALSVIRGATTTLRNAQNSMADASRSIFETLIRAGRAPQVDKAFQELGVRAIRALTNGLGSGRDAAQKDVRSILERISEIARDTMEGEDKKTRASIVRQSAALQDWVRSQGKALDTVWREVERAGTRLDSARERLKDLQGQFNQLRDSTTDSLRGELNLGSTVVDGETTFDQVAANVSGLAARMRTFARLLKTLIAAGLPAALVQEVAGLGSTEGIAVARALLSGTSQQRESLVSDFASIQRTTSEIGTVLAQQMFGAGIEAQKGLIRGLEANQAALIQAAKKIAKTITDAVRKELGIKSPSTVFRQIGEFITDGLAQGW